MANEVLAHAGVLTSVRRKEGRLLRTPPLFGANEARKIDVVSFSGGCSEYIYGARAVHLETSASRLPTL